MCCMYVASNSFVLPLRMNGMHSMQFDHAPLDLLSAHNLITVVLTVCHVKLTQSTAMEQKGKKMPHRRLPIVVACTL